MDQTTQDVVREDERALRELLRSCGDEEPLPLEEQIRRVTDATSRSHRESSRRALYGWEGSRDMRRVERDLAKAAPLQLYGDRNVLRHPGPAYNGKRFAGGLDDLSDEACMQMVRQTNEVGVLWERAWALSAEDVARNALVCVVLHDDELRPKAIERTRRWLDERLRALREDQS